MAASPPGLSLTPEEEQVAQAFLETVNHIRNEQKESPLAWNDALKFVIARKFDTKKALELFQNYCKTRIQENLLYIDPHEPVLQNELNSGKFSILARRDSWTGAAIALFTASLHCPLTASHESVLKGLIFQLDIALESIETQRHGIIFIYDMTESKYSNFDYELSVKILHLLKGCYPARLKKVLIVAAPLWFKAPFKVLQLFVREKLRDRIYTVSIPQIPYHISPESLPSRFGGLLEVNHELWIQHCLQRASTSSVSSAASASQDPDLFPSPPIPSSHYNDVTGLGPAFTACHLVDSNLRDSNHLFQSHNNHSNVDNRGPITGDFANNRFNIDVVTPSQVNGIYPLDNSQSSSNGNATFLSHGNPIGHCSNRGYLSARVGGSDIEKFVMEDQEKENGFQHFSSSSAPFSRKRSLSSSPSTSASDDVNNQTSVTSSIPSPGVSTTNDLTPQLPEKKMRQVMDEQSDASSHLPSRKRGKPVDLNLVGQDKNEDEFGLGPIHPALHRGVGTCSLLESTTLEPSIHDIETDGMAVEDLVQYVRLKGKKGLMRLYGILRAEDHEGTFVGSRYRQNMHKNRYTDVLALDHSRVHLSVQNGDPYSEYINANYVDGYRHKKAYISTQGPLAKTFGDFWRMVWENQTVCVVMTTRCVERSRIKCGRYWPAGEEAAKTETYDNITVMVKDCMSFNDYVVTELLLKNHSPCLGDKSSDPKTSARRVFHLQFLSWPDYGVPLSAAAMLDFMQAVREYQARGLESLESTCTRGSGDEVGKAWRGHVDGPPIVIHCSAGIGRTGTFIATDISTRRLEEIGTVDIDKTVRRIRTQRAFSIQMPDQYVFIHQAVLEFAQREGRLSPEDICLDGFDDDSDDSQDDSP